jgi:acyl carrier protein
MSRAEGAEMQTQPERAKSSQTKQEIFEQVRSILCREFEFTEDEIQPSSHLVDDLDLDSIDAIDLAVKLEERVGLDLEEEQLRSLRLVQDVVDLVHEHLHDGDGSPPRP